MSVVQAGAPARADVNAIPRNFHLESAMRKLAKKAASASASSTNSEPDSKRRRLLVGESAESGLAGMKCAKHSSTYSLYCETCDTPICARCCAHGGVHAKHEIATEMNASVSLQSTYEKLASELKAAVAKRADQLQFDVKMDGRIRSAAERKLDEMFELVDDAMSAVNGLKLELTVLVQRSAEQVLTETFPIALTTEMSRAGLLIDVGRSLANRIGALQLRANFVEMGTLKHSITTQADELVRAVHKIKSATIHRTYYIHIYIYIF